jgi:cytochrome P450
MPYTQATLIEAQRMCNVIPLVHRVATKKTKLGPYQIKKVHNLHFTELDSTHTLSQ